MEQQGTTRPSVVRSLRFALTKFRPTTLPATLLTRPALLERLEEGAGKRLTVVVGSAGAGKSVLLSSWAAGRQARVTSWLSCDEADADPVRFWAGFIEAPRAVAPGFGADAAELLAMDGAMSADVIASIANDAARLPAGSAMVVDDFHAAAAGAARNMTDLVERWPAQTTQLVLAGRADPPLRLHRLRLSGELCEVRDRDLYLSLAESGALLANFGVPVAAADLALLHERSEGEPSSAHHVAQRGKHGSQAVWANHPSGVTNTEALPDGAPGTGAPGARRPGDDGMTGECLGAREGGSGARDRPRLEQFAGGAVVAQVVDRHTGGADGERIERLSLDDR